MDVWNLVDIKEEIKNNRDDLSSFYRDYLNCLVDMEFSVLREYISEKERGILQLTNIYWKVSLYNLLHRTLYLLEKNVKVQIYKSEHGFAAMSSETEVMRKVFEFYHVYDKKFKLDYCHLSLFQLVPGRVKRLNVMQKMIDENLNCPCPYPKEMKYATAMWQPLHDEMVADLITRFDVLKEMTYTDDEVILMDMMERICDVLLGDYGSNVDEFKIGLRDELDDDYSIDNVLVKRYPNAHITWNGKII